MKKLLNRFLQWNKLNLQKKLVLIFVATVSLIIGINVVMFVNINAMMSRLDNIYVSNLTLDGLLGALEDVHNSMTEYLDTKSSDSLDAYYRASQAYTRYLDELNTKTVNDEMLLAEKNIYNLSLKYLDIVEDTINAKRGRDVEQYSMNYEKACAQMDIVHTFIYSLNNERFRANNQSYNVLLTTFKYLEALDLIMLVFASILDILLMTLFTGTIIRPLRELSEAAEQVGQGDFDVVVHPYETEDEIGVLSKTFVQMLESIKRYVVQIRENLQKESAMKERELMMEGQMKDAQLKYLQAQINPHFLFNTLNAGAQLAMLEGADKTTDFINKMASFFRYNLRKLDEDTTLGEELKLVDTYIYILNVRFAGEIRYEKRVDEIYEDIKVPSMILQPIVENAVNYGIRDIDREKIIEVSAVKHDECIEISIWDNGKGMDAELIRQILEGEYVSNKSGSGSNGIGLGNVIGRLELYFGESGLFDIKSEGPDMGTEMIIRIPLSEDENEDLAYVPYNAGR